MRTFGRPYAKLRGHEQTHLLVGIEHQAERVPKYIRQHEYEQERMERLKEQLREQRLQHEEVADGDV